MREQTSATYHFLDDLLTLTRPPPHWPTRAAALAMRGC